MKKLKYVFIIFGIIIVALSILANIPENRNEIETEHFTFLFTDDIDTVKIVELSNVLESNYLRISDKLKTTPAKNIETNIYSKRWRYIIATKNWGGSGNIEGTAKMNFIETAWDENDIRKIVVHEFAHTVVLKLLIDQEPQPLDVQIFDQKFSSFPTWLWESISVYEANQFVDPKTLPYLNGGMYPSISELNDRSKGQKIYDCGFTIVEYILSRYGQEKFIELIKNYGDLEKTFSLTENQFSKDWYEFIKKKYWEKKR